jgi:hypothetical protein
MALTQKQIDDLNNSMVAAQNVGLGTILNYLVGGLAAADAYASGSVVPTEATTVVDTGLATVTSVAVALSGSPTYDNIFDTATAGSVAGTIVISAWNALYTSASASWAAVNWVASGT